MKVIPDRRKQRALDEIWESVIQYSKKNTLSDGVGLLECVKYALLKLGNERHDAIKAGKEKK